MRSQNLFLHLVLLAVCAVQLACYSSDPLRKKATQEDATSQLMLGVMYDVGQGATQDYKGAATWYRKAAVQGNAYAQVSLGTSYFVGRGSCRTTLKHKNGSILRQRMELSTLQSNGMLQHQK